MPLMSHELLLPDEPVDQRAALLAQLMTELQPVGAFAQILRERIAVVAWRKRRLVRFETARNQVGPCLGIGDRICVKEWGGTDDDPLIERIEDCIQLSGELATAKDACATRLDGRGDGYTNTWQKLLDHATESVCVAAFLNEKLQGMIYTRLCAHRAMRKRSDARHSMLRPAR